MKHLEKYGITIEIINSLGYKQNILGNEDIGYYEFVADWDLGAKKHKIKGYNQPLCNDMRFINIYVKDENDYIDIGIRCDGKSRNLFNGVIQSVDDLKTIIRLID